MPKKKWDMVIVGGGAGGMVLALSLAKGGFRIALLDQKSPPIPPPRGEIIQPNGLQVLDRLGLLSELQEADVHCNRKVHFYQSSGAHLCTIDYARLPPPYRYAMILLPDTLQRLFLKKVSETANIETYWGAAFKKILWNGGRVAGLEADYHGKALIFHAPMVVGGDGFGSRVRDAFGIRHRTHVYADGYVTMVVDRPPEFGETSRYYLGRRKIFGAFPVSRDKIYLFYLVPVKEYDAVRKKGIHRLKEEMLAFHPEISTFFAQTLKTVDAWDATSFMRCTRVRCHDWVVDGGALLGDAAHAMNPHVAQGRNAAMSDGMRLAQVFEHCVDDGDFSQKILKTYELDRRRKIEILQDLGDEMTWIWNSKSPPIVWARNRIFRSIQKNADFHDKLLSAVAGQQIAPISFLDRWRALCS
ncbi:MAG: FAD-dependent oxidoreductase [Nitrospiria bacterium]